VTIPRKVTLFVLDVCCCTANAVLQYTVAEELMSDGQGCCILCYVPGSLSALGAFPTLRRYGEAVHNVSRVCQHLPQLGQALAYQDM
jgi:hypothetical protein